MGNYQIYVETKDENHIKPDEIDAYRAESFTLTNSPPEVTSFSPDKISLQDYGTTITWRATSSDSNGDTIYYRFLLSGPSTSNVLKIMQNWSTDNTWSWITSSSDIGENVAKVQVRDGEHAWVDGFDAEKVASFTITKPLQQMVAIPTLKIHQAIQHLSHY